LVASFVFVLFSCDCIVLDELIDQICFGDDPEGISPFLDEIFADLVVRAAGRSVPKLNFDQSKS
jgi:hypothetical protein